MTPENSRVSGDTEAKLRFVRDTLNQFHTVEDVAMFSTAMLQSIIPTDMVALAVVEGNVLRSVSTIGRRVIMDLSLNQTSINGRAVRTGQTQLVNDTRKDPDYFPGDGGDSFTMLSELCIPLIHEGKALGTINFESRQPGRFTSEEAEAAEAFAEEISDALHRVLGDEQAKGGLQTCYMTRTRSVLDRYHDVLRAVHEGESVMNKILNRTAIQWMPGKQLIDDLVSRGYLEKKKVSASRYAYRITEEGLKTLKTYEDIVEYLSK
jgi:putative methionine-R-sulfoxide reductase with GAF domain/predicted transcriptional regulator